MKINQFDTVELQNGREVVILDVYNNPAGYEVEDVDATSKPGYDGDPSFAVEPDQVKRVVAIFKEATL
jgi:uncharacterized protein YvpB